MDSIVLIRDPESNELVVLIPHCSVGFAPRDDGTIMMKLMDHETDMPIMTNFDANQFKEVVDRAQAALGSRIVAVSDAEVKEFGRGNTQGSGETPA